MQRGTNVTPLIGYKLGSIERCFDFQIPRWGTWQASTGRKWERIGRDWIELDQADEEHERQAELQSQRTESKALTASLKQLVGTCSHITIAPG
eukprot:1076135-Pyramimonas_sp.AAC.1